MQQLRKSYSLSDLTGEKEDENRNTPDARDETDTEGRAQRTKTCPDGASQKRKRTLLRIHRKFTINFAASFAYTFYVHPRSRFKIVHQFYARHLSSFVWRKYSRPRERERDAKSCELNFA